MVYWVNITSNDKRIFTYVHLRKAPCNEMQKATARGVHKSCLSKNDMVGTHSKPWRSSVKTPKQHKIAGKLNGMSFFLCVDPPISRTDPICTEPGPGSRTVPGSCGCRSFFLKTHVCCVCCAQNLKEHLQYLTHCNGFARKWFRSKGPGHRMFILDHSRWLFHMRNQCPAAPHNAKIQRVLNDVGIAGCFSMGTSETCFKTRYPVPLKKVNQTWSYSNV